MLIWESERPRLVYGMWKDSMNSDKEVRNKNFSPYFFVENLQGKGVERGGSGPESWKTKFIL